MCDSGEGQKRPRLFYWEDEYDAWCPVDVLDLDDLCKEIMKDGEEVQIKFKRQDMTDFEFTHLPEID